MKKWPDEREREGETVIRGTEGWRDGMMER